MTTPTLTKTPKPLWARYETGILLLFILLSLYWFSQTNFTWDDDAIGRYYNTRRAGSDMRMFLDSWNRPLFVLIFYVPVSLFGKAGVAAGMTLLTALSGFLLSSAAKQKGQPNYQFAAVFLVFQTFLFGITRDAMTEPLAAFIISLGIWCFTFRKWFWFAVTGGLLPLARPELIIVLVFWLIPLLQNKKYTFILLLGWGMGAWWLGWYLYAGDFMALVHELLKTGNKANRYERTSVFHHLNKYVYVLGVTVFFFLILGYLVQGKKLIKDYFVNLQFTTGFLIYVVFSSFLDLGQSGGALRNLITLSPFAALISLEGVNFWYRTWKQPGKNPSAVSSGKKKSVKKEAVDRSRLNLIISRALIIFYGTVILMISANVFTNKLVMRQYYDEEEKDYLILLMMCLMILLILLPYLLPAGKWVRNIIFSLLVVMQVGFTLYYENPQSHGGDERVLLNKMVASMNVHSLKNRKVHCNHLWYCWASGRNPEDTALVGHIDSTSLKYAENGTVFLWEPHYTNQNYSNIPLPMMSNDTTMIPFCMVLSKDEELSSLLFLKWVNKPGENTDALAPFAKDMGGKAIFNYFHAVYQRDRLRDLPGAIASFNKAIAQEPAMKDAYFHRAITYYNMGNYNAACADMHTAVSMGANDAFVVAKQMGCTVR